MRRTTLALVAAIALAGPAMAADEATTPTVAPKFVSVPADSVLSYNLVGLNIMDGQKNTVGEIKDLVIEGGTLKAYIVSVGGFLGMGERYVALDPASVSLGYDQEAKKWKAIAAANKDQLKAAPEFKYEGKFKR